MSSWHGFSPFPVEENGKAIKPNDRSGGERECTIRLVTTDIYRCVRHPHHVGVGIFMTSFGLHIGCPWSFVIISISQCVKIFGFLLLVEEKELVEKFGKAYESYRRKVPMIFTNPDCAIRVFHRSIDDSPK